MTAHSARVTTYLDLGDRRVEIAQLGPDFVILAQPEDLPSCSAWLVLEIDASDRRWQVRLPQGARCGRVRTPIQRGS